MKLLIQGNNIVVTDAIREYVNTKLEKSVRHFQNITSTIDVHLSVGRNPRITGRQKAEVTVHANGTVIRAQESSEDLYASIDLVSDKIARQLRKYKEKHLHNKTHAQPKTGVMIEDEPVVGDLVGDRTPELPSEVVRTKYFTMPPMSIEEALGNLQLVDHDFYMFCNEETGQINVIYQRNHGGYGVIIPRPSNSESNGKNGSNGHVKEADYESLEAYPAAQV